MRAFIPPTRYAPSDVAQLRFMLETMLGHGDDKVAERLIERFGSFSGVFNATSRELMEVGGMTERAALFFSTARPAFRRALMRSGTGVVDTEAALAAEAMTLFADFEKPHTYCLFTDKYGNVVTKKHVDNANVCRDIVGSAAREHAERVVVVECRPTSSPNYAALYRTAEKLARALDLIGIPLVDHIECRDFKIFSLRRAVLGKPLRFDIDGAETKKLTIVDGFADKIAAFAAAIMKNFENR